MPQKNSEEPQRYSMIVQIIGFGIFWFFPSIWLSHISASVFGLCPNDILLWIGLIIMNLATYSISTDVSARVNGHILWILICFQLLGWVLSYADI